MLPPTNFVKGSVDKEHVTRWRDGPSGKFYYSNLDPLWLCIKGAFKLMNKEHKWLPLPLNISTTSSCDLDTISPPWSNKAMLNNLAVWFRARHKARRCVWNHHPPTLDLYTESQAARIAFHLLDQPLLSINHPPSTRNPPPVSLSTRYHHHLSPFKAAIDR